MPYENMRQDTQPPVPVTTTVLPSSYNDPLPDTNPFSPNFRPRPMSSDVQSKALATVCEGATSQPGTRSSQAVVQAPNPQRAGEQRRSIHLRRLDGKPYANRPAEQEKPKIVKVAKDMHDGALAPVHKRQPTDTVLTATGTISLSNSGSHDCGKCGEKRGGHRNGYSCSGCGRRKSTAPASTTPTASLAASTAHARAVSESQTSYRSSWTLGQSTVGPSTSPSCSTHSGCCTKCGRYKRPSSMTNPFEQGRPNRAGPATAPVPMAGHPGMRPGLSILPNAQSNSAAYPKIDVILPSATTSKMVKSPSSTYGDDSPLVGIAAKHEFRLFRNSSLVRSLSRRLSRKDKNVALSTSSTPPAPLPSQQLARQSGEQSAENLINMISSAMQGPAHEREGQYARLEPARPETPFSFVGGKDESNGFETVDLRGDRNSVSTQNTWPQEPIGPKVSITNSDSDMVAGIPHGHIDVISRLKSTGPRLLTVDDAGRPPITRFKSLRQGVQRMGSGVSRSTSLRRFGSLKTVHHAWYVEASEGNQGNIIPAF